jgi:biopolymer transport protein ExbB
MAFSKKFLAWGMGAALLLAAGPAMAADLGAEGSGGTPSFVPPNWIFVGFDIFVLSLLGLASIAGIALAIDAILHIRESKIAPARTTAHLRSLIENRQYQDLLDFTATDKTFVSRALYSAIKRAHLKYAVMHEALEATIGEQTANLFRRIEPLNVIGNIGPLLGLLGTVLGMIMAFYELMRQGGNTPTASKLAGGIGTALWHTFFGLLVAIPCLVIYGFYRTKVDRITNRAANEAEELLESLRPSPGEGEEILRRRKSSRENGGSGEREAVAETTGAEE